MAAKRKISVRKVIQATVTLIVTAGCVLAITSASRIQDTKKLKGITIHIKNDQYGFVDKEEVKNTLLSNRHIDIAKTSLNKLDVHQMESIINANPWVSKAQIFVDNKKMVHVFITQRVPAARVFEQNGNSYYIDPSLNTMPLSTRYVHYSTVVTNVPVLKNDTMAYALRGQIVRLVRHIERDSFWSAQISQVIVNDDRTFELVPVLGNQKILFGDTTLMQKKFDNLFVFYKNILDKIGWDRYEVLDLRFAGQIVASPALPWKMPADKGLTNISWVKTVIGNDVKTTLSPDTPKRLMALKPAPAPVKVEPPKSKPVEVKQKPVAKKEVKKEEKREQPKKLVVAKKVVKKQVVHAKPAPKKTKIVAQKTETKKKRVEEKKTSPKYIYQGQ